MTWHFEAASFILKTRTASQGQNGSTESEVPLLAQAASDIMNGANHEKWCIELQELMAVAHENMRVVISSTELTHWRDVYTDACILKAIIQFRNSDPFDAVSTLDHAIIIAGTTSRIDIVLNIIHTIQSSIHREQPLQQDSQISKITESHAHEKSTIPCISPPSFPSFQTVFSRSPFILRNFAHDWPALNGHPWRKATYLRSVAGPGRAIPVEIGKDYRTNDWKQVIMSWDEFLSTLDFEDQPASKSREEILYMAQHDLTIQFPSLRTDIIIPDYVYASLSRSDFPDYRPPANEDSILFNTWLGPKGTMSPAHKDPYFNCYVQLVGYKSVWLAPPSLSSSMYPMCTTHSGDGSQEGRENNSMNNTSQVDVFSEEIDAERFPDYVNNIIPRSMSATLAPGDMLFFPPGWWHAMKSETTSLSFSLWF